MPKKTATIALELSKEDAVLLERVLQTESPHVAFDALCTAAAEEYVRMLIGQRTFTRGADGLEYRLLLLMNHAFDGRLPSERQVSAFFQITPTRARTLISAVAAKYQYQIEAGIAKTMTEILAQAEGEDGSGDLLLLRCKSDALVRIMKDKVKSLDGNHAQLRATPRVAEYLIAPSTRDALIEALKS
jgi:hypothetical protein